MSDKKALERNALKVLIGETQNPILLRLAAKHQQTDWRDIARWLEERTAQYLTDSLQPDALVAYRVLLKLLNDSGWYNFRPNEFVPGLQYVSAEILTKCIAKYRTLETFREAVHPQAAIVHTPRSDVYLAWKLGLLTNEEFERYPPKVSKGGVWIKSRRKRGGSR